MKIIELEKHRKKRAGNLDGNPPFYCDRRDLEVPNDLVSGLYERLHSLDFSVESPGVSWEEIEDPALIKDFPIFTCDYDDYFPKG